jgi:hypothetical protein
MNWVSTEHSVIGQADLYAVLSMDGRKLLLPQNEVCSLEPVVDINEQAKLPGTVGWIEFQDLQCSVYCLGKDLVTLAEIAKTKRMCVLLGDGERYLGLVCDQIETLRHEQLSLHPLPACMQNPVSPILALAIYREEVGCVTTMTRLATFLAQSNNKLERSDGNQYCVDTGF